MSDHGHTRILTSDDDDDGLALGALHQGPLHCSDQCHGVHSHSSGWSKCVTSGHHFTCQPFLACDSPIIHWEYCLSLEQVLLMCVLSFYVFWLNFDQVLWNRNASAQEQMGDD